MRKKTFMILKILIALISFLGTFLCKFNVCHILLDWADILFNICVGVFSSMVLVFFIDEISRRIQESKLRQDELEYIKRFNKIVELYIDQYTEMYYCVSTPLKNRTFEKVCMPENFTIKDMRDLHGKTLLVDNGFFNSSIDGFLKIELMLRNEFISLIERYSFDYYPQFVKIFTSFVRTSITYDCRDALNDSWHMIKNDEKYRENINYLFENCADELYSKLKNGNKVYGNIIHPYIFLFEMMKIERQFILDYNKEIEKVFNLSCSKRN